MDGNLLLILGGFPYDDSWICDINTVKWNRVSVECKWMVVHSLTHYMQTVLSTKRKLFVKKNKNNNKNLNNLCFGPHRFSAIVVTLVHAGGPAIPLPSLKNDIQAFNKPEVHVHTEI